MTGQRRHRQRRRRSKVDKVTIVKGQKLYHMKSRRGRQKRLVGREGGLRQYQTTALL